MRRGLFSLLQVDIRAIAGFYGRISCQNPVIFCIALLSTIDLCTAIDLVDIILADLTEFISDDQTLTELCANILASCGHDCVA